MTIALPLAGGTGSNAMDGVAAAQSRVTGSSVDLSAGVNFLAAGQTTAIPDQVPAELQASADDDASLLDRASRSTDDRPSLEGDAQYYVDGNPDYKQAEQGVQLGEGALALPVDQPIDITSPYGLRTYPFNRSQIVLHPGVDFAAVCGAPLYSAGTGTVTKAEANGTHGNQLIIDDGIIRGEPVSTVYNHMSSFAVKPGEDVEKGQLVGYVGATGKVTGCHLHFEVWVKGLTVDPMAVFPAGYTTN